MRVDGSIKTVTAGVTSLDDKRHTGIFAKQVDNFRCDPADGLVKRSPLIYTDRLTDSTFDPDVDAIFPVTLSDVLYWVLILPGQGSDGTHLIRVFDELGVEHDVQILPGLTSTYFNSLTGTDSVAFTTIGDTVYMGNKNEEIDKLDLEELWTKNSMLVIKQAPASFSQIDVSWTGSNNTRYEIETWPVPDFIDSDTGTNTTAAEIAARMIAETSPDNIYVQGSTILIERVDSEYASITATDGANDAVTATLNDETQDINNLPKYAAHNSVVKIRPDKTSDRGQFWMRATAFIETDDSESYAEKKINESLVEDAVLTVGENATQLVLKMVGYQRNDNGPTQRPFGNLVPNIHQATLINILYGITLVDEYWAAFFLGFDAFPPNQEDINFITIVHSTSGELVYASQIVITDPELPTYQGADLIDLRNLEVGEDYDIYYEELEDFFGKLPEVEWNECADPALFNHLNNHTMPHVLGIAADGTFISGPQTEMGLRNVHALRAREAGDDDTNPFPEFYSNTINDMGRFQDRLVMLSGETVAMSQTDKAHAWFRDTVTQQLAIDPIGMKAGGSDSTILNYIVTHNNDALLFTRISQYKITGSQGMTSQNAAMPQTTNYDNSATAKPISNGSDVFFSTAYSTIHAGMSRFQVDREADNQDIAVSISAHIQELLLGDVTLLAASSTLNMIVCKAAAPNILYIYEYVDRRKDPQTAWSRWIFPEGTTIRGIIFKEYAVEVVASDAGELLHMFSLRVNRRAAILTPRVMYLDYYATATGVNTTFNTGTYPWDDDRIKLYQGIGSPNPEQEIVGWSRGGSVVTVPDDLGGGAVAYGYPYRASFIPARKWVRDPSGVAQTASKLRITDWGFHSYADEINVDILNSPSPWPTQIYISSDPTNDQYNRISFKQRHDEADIEIWSDDPFIAEILQLEWRGTYYKTGRRF